MGMAELGTTGTLDGQQRLIIKGRFLPKVFEGVLRHYFIDYVICNMCKSSDTQLVKEATTRLSYCRCQRAEHLGRWRIFRKVTPQLAEAREEKQERWGHNRCLRRDCRKDLYIDKHVVLEEEEEEEEEEKQHRRRRRRYKVSN